MPKLPAINPASHHEEAAGTRAAFDSALLADDAQALILAGLVDWKLGLLSDAQNKLRTAVDRISNPSALLAYLKTIDSQMNEEAASK
jgi:hypothetical protein